MPVGLKPPQNIAAVAGVQLAATHCGIKKSNKPDLVLIALTAGTTCAAAFTRNAFCAAPVTVARQHLAQSLPRALLINAGNANAGTGDPGVTAAEQCCARAAEALHCDTSEVLPFSTGVIGEPLPVDKIAQGIEQLVPALGDDQWLQAARGIMTTDTMAKVVSKQIALDGHEMTITGMVKGSGMICPNMATLLAFIATDAKVEQRFLQACLDQALAKSFNAISIDGDTSTNDACVLLATGQSSAAAVTGDSAAGETFAEAVTEICIELAQMAVRDAEGATKFVTVQVNHAGTEQEARNVAYTIAHSPLVKTALFAGDPNWGRILAAVGRAGIDDLDINAVDIYLDNVCIVKHGARDGSYTEAAGQKVMQQEEITIRVELGRGDAQTTVWTSDLSYDYVKINAEYRT